MPWQVLYRPLPEDAGYPAPWDPGYPVRFGAEVVMDGVRVGYSMRQLRDEAEGMRLRCTTHLPRAAPPELVRAGGVTCTPAGEVHGLTNTGAEPFVDLTATTPPIDLTISCPRRDEASKSKCAGVYPVLITSKCMTQHKAVLRVVRVASELDFGQL